MKTINFNQKDQCPETKEILTKRPNTFIMYGNILAGIFMVLLFAAFYYTKIDFVVKQVTGNVFFKSGSYYFAVVTNSLFRKNISDKAYVALANSDGGSLGRAMPVNLYNTNDPNIFKITSSEEKLAFNQCIFGQQRTCVLIIKNNDNILNIFYKKIRNSFTQKYTYK
jgi:hypothetical protein